MKQRLLNFTLSFLFLITAHSLHSQSIDIAGPAGSGQFGGKVFLLSNGNYVVADPFYDEGAIPDVGAVYLYNGSTHTLISTLKGSVANDRISNGFQGIYPLPNGNFVVFSWSWHDGSSAAVGAATWVNGTTGLSGVVSSSNSLVGSQAGDFSGGMIYVLPVNGNYIVSNIYWANGAFSSAGFVCWCNGSTGRTGVVSSANSLVGTQPADFLTPTVLTNGNYVVSSSNWNNGFGATVWCNGTTGRTGTITAGIALTGSATGHLVGGVKALLNGHYLVWSSNWDNGAVTNVGLVTWCNGTTGRTGVVSAATSLVGTKAEDQLGSSGIIALTNGNYVVFSEVCDNGAVVDAGAMTWGNGTTGTTGTVSTSNSLMGSKTGDIGYGSNVISMSNGNYLVTSPAWDNGAVTDAGAVTWGNGTTGISGTISSSNSLIGSSVNDNVGGSNVYLLANGNYVVRSRVWDNGAVVDAGAVTWGNGTTGISGLISSANSLVGSTSYDSIGSRNIIGLTNGNYVVSSPSWDNGAVVNAGAVTWANGTTGITGAVSNSNSLVGTTASDSVGSVNIIALGNGNYVAASPSWDNGVTANVGAITWGNGTTGITGAVNSGNSLIGVSAGDSVGSGHALYSYVNGFGRGITALPNGNYVVSSPYWDNGAATNTGAITWCNGSTGTTGTITSSNSITGNNIDDNLGSGNDFGSNLGVITFSNDNYAVRSPNWDNGAASNSVAVTFGNGATVATGIPTSCNSVFGTASNGNSLITINYNAAYNYMIVGRGADNIVTIFDPTGLLMANSLDEQTVSIYGSTPVPLIAGTACRIIGMLAATGASPVSGQVSAKVWVESSVPTYVNDPYVARHYEITPAVNASTATGRITLYFTQQEFDDFNNHPLSILNLPTGPGDAAGKANLRISKFGGTSNDGSGLPGSYSGTKELINPNDADIVWSSLYNRWEVGFHVTGFSGFFVQTSPWVLPLTILEFNGQLQNDNGLLKWKTTNEINAASFDIERSVDGRIYTGIGNVPATNQPGDHSYTYTDYNISSLGMPVVYYRLKQKDINGQEKYSDVVALAIDKNKTIVLLYPNPVTGKATLTITTGNKEQLTARVIDNTGRIIKTMQWGLSAGSSTLPIDLKNIARGIYYLELKGTHINERKQFVKQ